MICFKVISAVHNKTEKSSNTFEFEDVIKMHLLYEMLCNEMKISIKSFLKAF